MDLLKKLNFKSQSKIHIINYPDEFSEALNDIKSQVTVIEKFDKSEIEFSLLFVKTIDELVKSATIAIPKLTDGGLLWFAYPKKSSKKYKSELTRDEGWKVLADNNFEPVRMIAIDEDWSAVRYKRVDDIKTMKRSTAMSTAGKHRIEKVKQ